MLYRDGTLASGPGIGPADTEESRLQINPADISVRKEYNAASSAEAYGTRYA
jgi:hypothetical protein